MALGIDRNEGRELVNVDTQFFVVAADQAPPEKRGNKHPARHDTKPDQHHCADQKMRTKQAR
ncbi:hypothetical protein GCM10023306_00130 [Novosphingobium ginsenosidimutans]